MKKITSLQTFKRWVVRYRNFAIALPVVLILTSFFIVENIKDFNGLENVDQVDGNGLNLELPGEQPKLDTKDNGKLVLEGNMDNENETKSLPPTPALESTHKSEQDSLQEIVKQLEALSFDGSKNVINSKQVPKQQEFVEREDKDLLSEEELKRKMVEDRLAYREMLKEGRDKIAGSKANPILRDNKEVAPSVNNVVYKAGVYRDQFILPDDNVELILLEDMVIDGKFFKKNTFIYALASIQGNRVLLDIDNINHVPVKVKAKDYHDGREGIYSQRAGELWREFKSEFESDAITSAANEATKGSGGLIRDMVREAGSFLRNKRLKERDKILLVNDHEILLVFE